MASQEYLSAILPRIRPLAAQKCDQSHGINMQIYLHTMTIIVIEALDYANIRQIRAPLAKPELSLRVPL